MVDRETPIRMLALSAYHGIPPQFEHEDDRESDKTCLNLAVKSASTKGRHTAGLSLSGGNRAASPGGVFPSSQMRKTVLQLEPKTAVNAAWTTFTT